VEGASLLVIQTDSTRGGLSIGVALLVIAMAAGGIVFAWRWWWPANQAFYTSMTGKPLDRRTIRYKGLQIGRWWVIAFCTFLIVIAVTSLVVPPTKG
jgi:hypothetical protein